MNLKKIGKIALAIGASAAVGTGAVVIGYVLLHKPDVVKNPCWRTFNRADGIPKKAYDSATKANFQSVKQFFRYGEICNPYQAGDKFFTGHSKNAIIRSINPFKSSRKAS